MTRQFFDEHVRPNYDEWLASPLDERLAKNAVEKGTLPFSPHFDLAAVRTQRSAWACSATATPTSTVRS